MIALLLQRDEETVIPLITQQLTEMAHAYAATFRRRASEYAEKIRRLEVKIIEAKAHRDASIKAADRVGDFEPTDGSVYYCPECFVSQGVNVPLSPQPGSGFEELFRCRMCGAHFSFEIRP